MIGKYLYFKIYLSPIIWNVCEVLIFSCSSYNINWLKFCEYFLCLKILFWWIKVGWAQGTLFKLCVKLLTYSLDQCISGFSGNWVTTFCRISSNNQDQKLLEEEKKSALFKNVINSLEWRRTNISILSRSESTASSLQCCISVCKFHKNVHKSWRIIIKITSIISLAHLSDSDIVELTWGLYCWSDILCFPM